MTSLMARRGCPDVAREPVVCHALVTHEQARGTPTPAIVFVKHTFWQSHDDYHRRNFTTTRIWTLSSGGASTAYGNQSGGVGRQHFFGVDPRIPEYVHTSFSSPATMNS